jgi:hypothetical protein
MAELDREVDALYAGPPSDFIAARDALAARLKKEGDASGASEVKALRRPTVPAWAINQLARTDAAGVAELLRAGDALRKAQRKAMSGGGSGGFREAAAARRSIVSRLTDDALEILERAGSPSASHRDAVAATLEAASSDQEAGALLRLGRLVKEIAPPTEFGALSPLSVIPAVEEKAVEAPAPPKKGAARKPAKPTAAQKAEQKAAEAEAKLQAARDEARIKAREAQASQRRADRARDEADRADVEASRLEDRARQSRERHRFLDERAKNAESEAAAARKEADAAARREAQLVRRRT